MGRKKIEIKKISDKNTLKVTFSKRRQGLFRKAGDLCSKSGAQIAIITFSPGDKPFTFGHRLADSVIDRYCYPCDQVLYVKNAKTTSVIDEEDKKLKFWLEKPIEGMELDELKQFGRWVEDDLEETKMRRSCTKMTKGLSSYEDEMELGESCTKDFLANWE